MPSIEAGRVRRPGFDAKSPPAEPSGRSWRLWSVLPVCAGFAVFGVVVWMAYQDASLGPPGGEPPLIRAAPEPIKLPPDQAEEAALAAEQGEVGQLWSDAEQAPARAPAAIARAAFGATGRRAVGDYRTAWRHATGTPRSRRCRPTRRRRKPPRTRPCPRPRRRSIACSPRSRRCPRARVRRARAPQSRPKIRMRPP